MSNVQMIVTVKPRWTKRLPAVCAALVLGWTSPLFAQVETDTGSHIAIPRRARVPEDTATGIAVARAVTADFARCLVSRYPKGVVRAVEIQPGSGSAKALADIEMDECLDNGQITIPHRVMRGAIFVELYRVYHAKNVAVLVRRPLDFSNPLDVDFRDNAVRFALFTFADCVIKRDEKDASDVVLLPTASKQQDAAFKALMPNLGPCLTQGQQISLSKPVLEGAIAEVLYRGVIAPVATVEKK